MNNTNQTGHSASSTIALPHSAEAEECVIACCVADQGATLAPAFQRGITSDSFYAPAPRIVWDKIVDLSRRGVTPTIAILAEDLKASGQFDAIGGYAYLSHLVGRVATTAQASYFIEKVVDLHSRRGAILHAAQLIEKAKDTAAPFGEIVAATIEQLQKASSQPGTIKPFTVWSPSQFEAYKADASALLLGDGYIERGEWTSLMGIGGLGKSRLATLLAICQITGREWCGIATHGLPQKIVFLSSENGVRRWQADLFKMLANLTAKERAAVESNLRILVMTQDDDGDLCLGNAETFARLRATLKAENSGLVIFDPFADMIEGDENKAVDVIATLRALRSLTRAACPTAAVLIIHHARAGASNVAQAGDNFSAGNFGRGSKALYSRVRCELQLAPRDRDDPNRLVLACGKSNNSVKFAPRGITFDPETFTYTVDESFNVDSWRDDVNGKRKGFFTFCCGSER